jgi:hypothetical protein
MTLKHRYLTSKSNHFLCSNVSGVPAHFTENTPLLIYKDESQWQITNARRSLCKVSVVLSDFKPNRNLSANYSKNSKCEIHENFYNVGVAICYVAMLLCCYVAMFLCCYVATLLWSMRKGNNTGKKKLIVVFRKFVQKRPRSSFHDEYSLIRNMSW